MRDKVQSRLFFWEGEPFPSPAQRLGMVAIKSLSLLLFVTVGLAGAYAADLFSDKPARGSVSLELGMPAVSALEARIALLEARLAELEARQPATTLAIPAASLPAGTDVPTSWERRTYQGQAIYVVPLSGLERPLDGGVAPRHGALPVMRDQGTGEPLSASPTSSPRSQPRPVAAQ